MVSAWVKSSKPILVKKFQSEFETHFGEDFFLTESENTWLPRFFFVMKFEIWSHFHFDVPPLPGDVEQQEGLILITYSLMVYACDTVWSKKCGGSSQMDASFSTSCWGGIINARFYSEERKKQEDQILADEEDWSFLTTQLRHFFFFCCFLHIIQQCQFEIKFLLWSESLVLHPVSICDRNFKVRFQEKSLICSL